MFLNLDQKKKDHIAIIDNHGVTTVSYTHLYSRYRSFGLIINQLQPAGIIKNKILKLYIPVSYTHLDVYKRQQYVSMPYNVKNIETQIYVNS